MTDQGRCLPGMTQSETEALVRTIVAQVVKIMAEQGLLAPVDQGIGPSLAVPVMKDTSGSKAWAPSPASTEGVLRFGSGPRGSAPASSPHASSAPAVAVSGGNRFNGRLVSEEVIIGCVKAGQSNITVAKGTIVTPLARDTAREKGITIVVE